MIWVGVKQVGSFFLLPWLTNLGLLNSWHCYVANVQAPALAKRDNTHAGSTDFVAFQLGAFVREFHVTMQN